MNITIRKPEANEWQQYKKLRLQSLREFPLAFSSSYEENQNKPDDYWREILIGSINLAESLLLCAYDAEEMIGCVGAYWKDKKKTRHVANVGLMYLKPEYQGQSIGVKLLMELISKLKGMDQFKKMKLEVVTTNLPAFNLYKKVGFVENGVNRDELLIDGKYYDTTQMELVL